MTQILNNRLIDVDAKNLKVYNLIIKQNPHEEVFLYTRLFAGTYCSWCYTRRINSGDNIKFMDNNTGDVDNPFKFSSAIISYYWNCRNIFGIENTQD